MSAERIAIERRAVHRAAAEVQSAGKSHLLYIDNLRTLMFLI